MMNVMKLLKAYSRIIVAMLFLATFFACSQTDTINDNTNQRLLIKVSDAGYESANPRNLGTEEDTLNYRTVFTGGDTIGLFAVQNEKIISNNVKLTAKGTSGENITWETDNGTASPLVFDNTVSYYAYFPYQKDLDGKIPKQISAADDAKTFFDKLIKSWTVETDQSDHKKFQSYDLMVSKGEIKDNSLLNFKMQHQMALASMKIMAGIRYINIKPPYEAYLTPKFDKFQPFQVNRHIYLYLVDPNDVDVRTKSLTGGYLSKQFPKYHWECPLKDIKASCVTKYTIDKDLIIDDDTKLEIGDLFMKDGTIIGKDETFTQDIHDNAIGIVYLVGKQSNDTLKYINQYGEEFAIHGYILSIMNVTGGSNGGNADLGIAFATPNGNQYYNWKFGTNQNTGTINGFSDWQKISNSNLLTKNYFGLTIDNFPLYKKIKAMNEKTDPTPGQYDSAPPKFATNWFLPSYAEMDEVVSSSFEINPDIVKTLKGLGISKEYSFGVKTGGSDKIPIIHFWTSTESSTSTDGMRAKLWYTAFFLEQSTDKSKVKGIKDKYVVYYARPTFVF